MDKAWMFILHAVFGAFVMMFIEHAYTLYLVKKGVLGV